jgi:haloalkane dehalogenase
MTKTRNISPAFPFEPHYVYVKDCRMHYVDEGSGLPILFIHGNPTWSYLWRNVIPHVTSVGRAIAVDLIGMGRSDKPDIEYRFFYHYDYLEGFIEALGLERIHIVANDWGTALACQYIASHESNVQTLTLMGSCVMPWPTWEMFAGRSHLNVMWRAYRAPELGWDLVVNHHLFVEPVLNALVIRQLFQEEMDHYLQPYMEPSSRRPLWQFPKDLPIGGEPKDVVKAANAYVDKVRKSEIPTLHFYYQEIARFVEEYRRIFKNLTVVDAGEAGHFMPEDQPDLLGTELARWLRLNTFAG